MLGFVVGDEDISFMIGFAVIGFKEEGLDDGLLVVAGGAMLSTTTVGLNVGVRVVGKESLFDDNS